MKHINIKKVKQIKSIPQSSEVKGRENFNSSSLSLKPLVANWGIVMAIYSEFNSADVEVNGLLLPCVPVRSLQWVYQTDEGDSKGERDLPPIGSKVLVLFPDSIIDNAFILCSAFDPLVESQSSELLVQNKENEYLKIDETGWKTTRDKETGNIIFSSPDDDTNQIIIEVNREDSFVKISLGDYSIILDKGNTKLEAIVEDHKAIIDQDKISLEHSDGNKITIDTNGIKEEDKNGNVRETKSTGVFDKDTNNNRINIENGLIDIANQVSNLKDELQKIYTKVDNFVTLVNTLSTGNCVNGSPLTTAAAFQAAVIPWKADFSAAKAAVASIFK